VLLSKTSWIINHFSFPFLKFLLLFFFGSAPALTKSKGGAFGRRFFVPLLAGYRHRREKEWNHGKEIRALEKLPVFPLSFPPHPASGWWSQRRDRAFLLKEGGKT